MSVFILNTLINHLYVEYKGIGELYYGRNERDY